MKREYTNEDCMDLMARYPDKHFDLAIVDPPYGIQKGNLTGFQKKKIQHEQSEKCSKWDIRPDSNYFLELFRISKNQIIWGMQYFAKDLPDFSQLIIWDKKTGDNYFADGESAFCSISGTLRIFRHQWCGAFKESERNIKAIHVNQKPIALYKWLLSKYAKPGWLILDTHVGSASSLIACEDMGFEYIACEKDADYYRDSTKRIEEFRRQGVLEF